MMMTFLSETCSKCGKGWNECECENFHPNVVAPKSHSFDPSTFAEPGLWLSLKELKALFRIFEREYLPYDDLEVHAVTRKIMNIIKAHDNG